MANTGKTNAKWIRVFVDDETPALRDISLDVTDVNMPIASNSTDVTGYSDGVINFTMGQPGQPISMTGIFSDTVDIGAHDVLSNIVNQSDPTVTVKVQIGIRKAPEATNPEYLGEFLCTDYTVNGDLTWNAAFVPGSTAAPVWGLYT
jgi:hypothetical protein